MLRELTLSESLWGRTSEDRHEGWRKLIEEVRAETEFAPALTSIHIELDTSRLRLLGRDDAGAECADVLLDRAELDQLMDEYLDIVCQLGDPDRPLGVTRLEALDMAKRVVHDRAGRLLVRRGRALGLELGSARRLFSLVVALAHDTTKLGAGLRHRRR